MEPAGECHAPQPAFSPLHAARLHGPQASPRTHRPEAWHHPQPSAEAAPWHALTVVSAAHPSVALEGMVRAERVEKRMEPAREDASEGVRSVRTPLGVIRSSSRYAALSLS